MNGFTLDISDWYGNGAGLSALELVQDDIVAYADNAFNEPVCQVGSQGSFANISVPALVESGFPATTASYLLTKENATITMAPKLLKSGNYSIRLFTPGCVQDGTCPTRGIVNVQIYFDEASPPQETQLFQTNFEDKYDTIFQGRIQAQTPTFRPRVVVFPAPGQAANQTFVAQKVQFMALNPKGDQVPLTGTSRGNLNGLYAYSAANWSTQSNDTLAFPIDVAGMQLDFDAYVSGIQVIGTSTFVVGTFTSTGLGVKNVLHVNGVGSVSVPGGGLNGPVDTLVEWKGKLFLGGQFTNTVDGSASNLNFLAQYDPTSQLWTALGQGVNGNVSKLVLYTFQGKAKLTVIVVSGQFTQILGSPAIDVPGVAIWIPSLGEWAERLGSDGPFVSGQVTAETTSPNGTVFVAGDIAAWRGTLADGVVSLTSTGITGLNLGPSISTATNSKRSLNSQDETSSDVVINAVEYYTENNQDVTIVGGHFSVSNASNVAFINRKRNNLVTGLPAGLSSNASVYTLLVNDNRLYIGGDFTGSVNSNAVQGLTFYDFTTQTFDTTQPPALTGSGPVLVNVLSQRPNSAQILVGGVFSSAGSFPCPSLCIYDSSKSQWIRPGTTDIEGEISNVSFESSDSVIVVGNISIGGNKTFVGRYNFQSSVWTSLDVGVTGPVEAVISQDTNTTWLVGQNSQGLYFGKWNGTGFMDLSIPHASDI
jgi:Rax2 C-terminal beta propeller domain/Rax2 third domain